MSDLARARLTAIDRARRRRIFQHAQSAKRAAIDDQAMLHCHRHVYQILCRMPQLRARSAQPRKVLHAQHRRKRLRDTGAQEKLVNSCAKGTPYFGDDVLEAVVDTYARNSDAEIVKRADRE